MNASLPQALDHPIGKACDRVDRRKRRVLSKARKVNRDGGDAIRQKRIEAIPLCTAAHEPMDEDQWDHFRWP
ncbi:hypothetical protein GCM10007385_32380 [Tateyamaria omphalii]|nr:hypothetical protein GCM10007385_32380 [Tateyamaria omphalii]